MKKIVKMLKDYELDITLISVICYFYPKEGKTSEKAEKTLWYQVASPSWRPPLPPERPRKAAWDLEDIDLKDIDDHENLVH